MIGLGTLANTIGVILGGCLGLVLGQRLSDEIQDGLTKATGLAVLFLGIAGAMEGLLRLEQDQLVSQGGMLVILSLGLGTLVGECLGIERGFDQLGHWLKKVTKNQGDTSFTDAFVTASLTTCIGAMAIVGPIQDGLLGNPDILFAKTVLDLIIVMILTVSKGKGAMFSALPILFIQGSITLLARFIAPVITESMLANLSMVGSILIFCVGLNLVWGRIIKVGNMLPAILLAVLATFLPFF